MYKLIMKLKQPYITIRKTIAPFDTFIETDAFDVQVEYKI